MRNGQVGLRIVKSLRAVNQQVEVDGPGTVVHRLAPAQVPFDVFDGFEQRDGKEGSFELPVSRLRIDRLPYGKLTWMTALMKESCWVKYMGFDSYRCEVAKISVSLLALSRAMAACSMDKRLPMLLPKPR
jgi:hypothetical protein